MLLESVTGLDWPMAPFSIVGPGTSVWLVLAAREAIGAGAAKTPSGRRVVT
jgi:hypothetical protein